MAVYLALTGDDRGDATVAIGNSQTDFPAIGSVAGRPDYPVVHAPKRPIDHIEGRSVDSSRIRQELNWFPKHTLHQGLAATYAWLRQRSSGEERTP